MGRLLADAVVLAAGAWTGRLLASIPQLAGQRWDARLLPRRGHLLEVVPPRGMAPLRHGLMEAEYAQVWLCPGVQLLQMIASVLEQGQPISADLHGDDFHCV